MSEAVSSRQSRVRMPLLLLCGTGFLTFFAGLSSLVVIAISLIAGLGHGPFTVDGRPATKAEFWGSAGPLVAVFAILALFAWLFVLSVWKERPRSRERAMVLWFVVALAVVYTQTFASLPTNEWVFDLLTVLGCGVFAAWYLYRKPGVVQYYKRLHQRAGAA